MSGVVASPTQCTLTRDQYQDSYDYVSLINDCTLITSRGWGKRAGQSDLRGITDQISS